MTFNEKLVKLRKIKGLTQDEFASAVGVSRQAVYKWESGQSYPEVSKLLEIKMLFGISIDDLLDDTFEVVVPEKKKRKRLSKAITDVIEEKVREEEKIYTPATSEEKSPATEPAPVAEPVPVEDTAPVEAAEPTEESAPAPAPEYKDEEIFAPEPEQIEEKKEEKKGFFGRLFGRK